MGQAPRSDRYGWLGVKPVNCIEYIEDFLSAHADGELSESDLRDAEQHLRRCLGCRAKLADERALKNLIREHIEMRTMPDTMRRQLLEALDRAASEEETQTTKRHGRLRAFDRSTPWILLALAAALAIVLVTTRRFAPPLGPVAATAPSRNANFDLAIAAFSRFERKFTPNLPSDSSAALSAAYAQAKMPAFIWNFDTSGLRLVGGRLEKLPDGRKVTYTFYRGAENSILCTRFKADNASSPPGPAQTLKHHRFYRYRGYSVCYAPASSGGFVCILTSRLPLGRMEQAVRVALRR